MINWITEKIENGSPREIIVIVVVIGLAVALIWAALWRLAVILGVGYGIYWLVRNYRK